MSGSIPEYALYIKKSAPPTVRRITKQKGTYFTILLSDLPAVNPGVLVAGILISAPV